MKKIIYTVLLLVVYLNIWGQWSNQSFTFGGQLREYRIYIPSGYSASNPTSLVLTLHGLGDNIMNFSGVGMNYVADTANIIVLVPQALADPLLGTAWNSGAGAFGYYPNSGVNDTGFLNAMIDSTMADYAVNPLKIYVCGFSMGGFMTHRMACESNGRIAAIASVSGTRGSGIAACNPARNIPVAHFHGTADGTVGYTGNTFGMDAEPLVQFWADNNHCDAPVHTTLPDIAADGLTIDHYLYPNGWASSEVEFFKINNGAHTWLFLPENDIDYTREIWRFFRKHTLQSVSVSPANNQNKIRVFPNPAGDKLSISIPYSPKSNLQLYDIQGNLMFSKTGQEGNNDILLSDYGLSQGVYFLKVDEQYIKVMVE
ncbi:MAG: T9SS type A sorting domain-containing protein [Bacteroidia bacterium]|nr:T9SS type A sorting domain-containing protein [Bacteroidia bacterium]